MKSILAVSIVSAVLLFVSSFMSFAGDSPVTQSALNVQAAQPPQSAQATAPSSPTKLSCRAARVDLGMYESLRIISITVDPGKKYVKMVHEGDGKTIEFTDGVTSAQGNKNFVKVTDEVIVYGQGRESWKIDRYTGTLTSASIAIPFECQLRPAERKF